MHPAGTAVMNTLCYADVFEYPLTVAEIHRRLIAASPVSLPAVRTAVANLHADGRICRTGPYYHLPGKTRCVRLRSERARFAAAKTHQAMAVARQLISIPYVEAVFLTGAVAAGNAPANDDIDMMIVTAPHSLWSCRVLVNLWLDIRKLRRRPRQKAVSDKVCPNLFLTAGSLTVPFRQRNLYTAHEVIQTKPLADPRDMYSRFLDANRWVAGYLANRPVAAVPPATKKRRVSPVIWETALRQLQYWYMYSKITRETITRNSAYFHPRDTAGIVLAKYRQRIVKYE